MNMGERMLGLRRQRLNNSWDVCTALLRGWLRVWRSIAPQRCMLCGAVSQKLAIARTVEASNPPTDPYSSQRTHTGNNRPLLHAWTTLELTAGPTATRTDPPSLAPLGVLRGPTPSPRINQHKLSRRDSPASQRSLRFSSRPRRAATRARARELKEAPPNHENPRPASTTKTSGTSPGYARRTRS